MHILECCVVKMSRKWDLKKAIFLPLHTNRTKKNKCVYIPYALLNYNKFSCCLWDFYESLFLLYSLTRRPFNGPIQPILISRLSHYNIKTITITD